LANPAFGTFLNAGEVMSMAGAAKRMPAREAEYRNLILNQRVEPTNAFIAPEVWKNCGTPVGSLSGLAVYGGLHLSGGGGRTAVGLDGVDGQKVVGAPDVLASVGGAGRAVNRRQGALRYVARARLSTSDAGPDRVVSVRR